MIARSCIVLCYYTDVTLGIVCPMANEGDESVTFCQAVLEQCSDFQKVAFTVFDCFTKDSSLDQMRYEMRQTDIP